MTPQKAVEALEREYERRVDQIAAEVRAKYVVPFCDKHGLRFRSGMGGYVFDSQGQKTRDGFDVKYGDGAVFGGRDLPKRLKRVLETDVFHRRQCLGSFMQDYTATPKAKP